MRIEQDLKLGFKDVLIRPKRSTLKSRAEVKLERHYTFLHSKRSWTGIPIIAANMDTVGTFAMAEALAARGLLCAVHKHYALQSWQNWLQRQKATLYQHIMVSTGTAETDMEKLRALIAAAPALQFICIDVANGYAEAFVAFVSRVREAYPQMTIIAGNVVTGEMVEELLLAGADVVKVGIGPGSVCTTRVKTGVGYPQLSAVIECADAAHGLGGRIISDGGCTCAGDVAKAFGGGADFVMLGGMLAGHDECGGELVNRGGQHYKLFYGMSSSTAMDIHAGGVAEYRSSEGKTVEVPYRGPVEGTLRDILGGVRSACTYIGAAELRELSKRTTFIRVMEQENRSFN
ncbi:MAG: GMP reductase [Deltaproteobacteria bacterium]|nr:GMP reductase [Deltaproteobacteria bacterium]NCP77653.1 GMP reductase [Desulfuromonadales bacterium]